MSMIPVWLLTPPVAIGLAVVAALLFVVGRRGRRVDRAPLCRRCGYDLACSEADAQRPVLPATCAECGLQIESAARVRVGHRRPIRALYVAAALAVLPAAMLGTLVLSPMVTTPWFQKMHRLIVEAEYGAMHMPGRDHRAMRTVRREVTIEVVDQLSQTCEMADDENTAALLSGVTIGPMAVRTFGTDHYAVVDTLRFPEVPMPLAFEAWSITAERRFGPWFFTIRGTTPHGTSILIKDAVPISDPFVRIELRSSVGAAERTADLTRIWSGTLVFDNVPVTGNAPLNPDGSFPKVPPPRVVGGGATPETTIPPDAPRSP